MNKVDTIHKQDLIINAVFHLSKLERITKDESKINGGFFRLKKEFPEYFNTLLFNENWQSPISNDLNNILSIFKLSGMLCSGELGIFGKYYNFFRDEEYAERLKDDFSADDIVEIQEMANKFREYIQ